MAPYSEHRTGNVEMYEVSGHRYLRIPYRAVVYDLVPRTYVSEQWIEVGVNSSGEHKLSPCPPKFRDRYGPGIMKGTVEIRTSEVHIDLMFPAVNRPYKFNGTWSLVEVKGQPPAPSDASGYSCESDAL